MQQLPILKLTAVAIAPVLAQRFVGFDGAQVDAVGGKPFGVAEYGAAIGSAYQVNVLGTAKVEAGAAIPIGAKGLTPVKSDATGRAIPHAGAGEIAGYARQPAAAAGAVIEILLTP